MPELPKKKVGIVACSGEELAEGTVTRLAALKVLEQLRPSDTVTICLPLFLAGGEGDRAFARFYPTVAIDGCDRRCAARATEMYSGKPAASVVVTELVSEAGIDQPAGPRRLNDAGLRAVDTTSARVAEMVDSLLERRWNRRTGAFTDDSSTPAEVQTPAGASCSCNSGIPVQTVEVQGRGVKLVGLPLIFRQFHEAGRRAEESVTGDLMETVKIYNPILSDAEADYARALLREYAAYCAGQEVRR
ncbi:MAG TPA: putative zinc-binding protein [Anaerolineales bacterium]|nr:putative zinc-binding protein [Anaerolineales bacterium]